LRFLALLLLAATLLSCTNTRYSYNTGQPVVESGNRMLITKIKGFSDSRATELAEETREMLIDDLFTVYLPEEEYELLKKGIAYDSLNAEKLSVETQKKIEEILNVRYLLDVELINVRGGASYGSYTNSQLNRNQEPLNRNDESNTASVLFTITDMKNPSRPRSFTVTVRINPLVIPEEEGEQRINATNVNTASIKAYSKGIKRIKKAIF